MSKYKLITILSCGLLITGAISTKALATNISKVPSHHIIESHILLSAPSLNNLAVVINTNQNSLVLYNSASTNSNIESYISVGEMLNYTPTSNPNFYKVTVQETGACGYISADNMQIIESGLNKAYTNINRDGQVINVTYDVKLMSSPDVHSQILGSYKNNTHLTILGKQDQWYKVNIGKQIGYMYQSYVGIDNTSANVKTTPSNTNINTTKTVNNNIASNNAHKQFTISEKMITQDGTVIVPKKVIYKGDNYNPENIKTMVLPKGYQFGKLNVYNNGVMVETGGTQADTLVGFNLNLPSINHLKSGNLVIEYIVQKIPNTTSTSNKATINTPANTIKIINYTNSQMIKPNDIIVENKTEKPISNTQLISVIKNWILTQQYNYSGFADCNGTMWSKQWLDNIPNSLLIDYFTESNGQAALSKNITASELNKTAKASLAFAKKHPNPFSQAQAKRYIAGMLKQSYPDQVITKIVFHGTQAEGGDYYVYTKQLGNKTPYWYVESPIGYATGV